MDIAELRGCVLLLLLMGPAAGLAFQDFGAFDGLYDGYNISQYLESTGRLGRTDEEPQQGRAFRGRPRRRAFSVGLFGVPDGTTLRFQLQVVRPFASEYTDFLSADQFKTEWYMSLRYKVSDLQATVFRKFQGPARVNMSAAYHMMNTTAQMMQNLTSAAADYQQMADGMADMSPAEQQPQEAEFAQYGPHSGSPERYWAEHGRRGGHAVPWDGYVNRRGEVGGEPEPGRDAELLDAQHFRIEQKMKIYERMEQMYSRQGQDGMKCVLRAICEVAEAPMEDGVLGDVVNLLLSATNGVEDLLHAQWLDTRYRPYLEAHMFGETRGGCGERYSACGLSVIDPTSLALF